MAEDFCYRRRVQFAETDLAGLVHFSVFFRYMEEAEHALWRAAGLTIARAGEVTGWPRLSASFDFKAPLRFEEEFDTRVRLSTITARTMKYEFRLERGETLIGEGSITTGLVSKAPGEPLKMLDLPLDIVDRLRGVYARAGSGNRVG
jgi:YbgC/YbaW family acyl-CoA thioester hydrolase